MSSKYRRGKRTGDFWIGYIGAGIAGIIAVKIALSTLNSIFRIGTLAVKTYSLVKRGIPWAWSIAKAGALRVALLAKTGAITTATVATRAYGLAKRGVPWAWSIAKAIALRVALLTKAGAMATATVATRAYGLASTMAVGGIRMLGGVIATVGRAMLMNPIGLAVTAIAGSVYLIYQNWGAISSFFSNLWGSVTNFFNNSWNNLKSASKL